MRLTERLDGLSALFTRLYGPGPIRFFRAAGRINIIGEHTDYNEGFVLPAAIDRSVLLAVRPRRDRMATIYSANLLLRSRFSLDRITRASQPWSNYVRGVVWALQAEGARLPALDAAIESTVPIGAGLSSSAALEVAAAFAWQKMAGLKIPGPRLAVLCRRAENEFVGVPCGIMDQFAARMGKRGSAILLDCRSLQWQRIPLDDREISLVVADTGVRRALAASQYAVRRQQCQQAVEHLRKWLPDIRSLRDVARADFDPLSRRLPTVLRRRARHVITENERVHACARAIAAGDWDSVGALMNESHESLRTDYQVSSPELDDLVRLSRGAPGVLGARMMGAGFGGCALALVRKDAVDQLTARITKKYPQVFACSIENGAEEIRK